jgi:dephospho-CoA kinase
MLHPSTAPAFGLATRAPPSLPSEEPLSYPPGMLLVGLTGGIGSGKSTVAGMFAARGTVVFDADEFARRAVDPGTPGHDRVVETFGTRILTDTGEIDRERLARVVFDDPDARRRLEAIIHPEVRRQFAGAVEAYRGTDRVVVQVVPLLVENRLEGAFEVVVVVSASESVRVMRAVASGSMSEDSVRARMAAQVTDEERELVADVIIRNEGTLEELDGRVDGVWEELRSRARSG